MAETFNVVVEIPRGSKNKYEVDHETGRVFPGCVVKCRAVGLYHMVDEAGGDDKVLCVPADVRFDDIKDISDVNEYHKAEIKHFFEQYKALEPGKEVLPGDYWTGAAEAEKEIVAARERLANAGK